MGVKMVFWASVSMANQVQWHPKWAHTRPSSGAGRKQETFSGIFPNAF